MHPTKVTRLFRALLPGILLSTNALCADAIPLPSDLANPVGSGTTRGLLVRTVQAPQTEVVANSAIRAIKQLNGTLLGADGTVLPNEAVAGTNPDGGYTVDLVSFLDDGTSPMDIKDETGNILASFDVLTFPGIPGTEGHTENFAAEVIAFLELPAGQTTFGMSVGADRTDVNNDDAYQVYVAPNPRDFFGTTIADYQRAGEQFVSKQHIENQFTVQASSAGLYPFRIVYCQTGLGANLNFYTVDTATSERVLVNDSSNPNAVKAYTGTSVAAANAPAVVEVSPLPGSAGINSAAPITAELLDGTATVTTSNVKLYLNGTKVTPQRLTKSGSRIHVSYDPNASRTTVDNQVRLEYKDSAGVSHTNSWSFAILVSGGATTTVTGQWDFEKGDLSATVGNALAFFGGDTGITKQKTLFGTTTELGISDINGKVAKVMEVPGDASPNVGYIMAHGISPNGGGTKVNQYTLIMDVYVEETGAGAASLIRLSNTNLNNGADGDLFWQGNNFGQGTGGYNGRGTFTPGAWHRVVAAYDEAATPPVVAKFVDGIKQDDWTANQGLDNARRAMQPTAVLFCDNGDERRKMWVNSVQIRAGKLSDAEIVALAGPSAEGIPQTIPQSTVTGQWDFQFGDLGASVGKALQYFDGTEGITKAGTEFGTTTDLGVLDIDGKPAKVMKVPGDSSPDVGYIMAHGIAPNGGGTKVNQYTLIMDVLIDTTGPGAASLIRISNTNLNNTSDGDLFWQGNNFGQGSEGYKGTGIFTPGEWHRVVAAYDEAATKPVVTKFVDGVKQDDWTANQGLDNARRALQPLAILFCDNGDERRTMWVSSIQIRSTKLSDAEIVALGKPTSDKIPVAILGVVPETPPVLTATRAGTSITISWPTTATGFTLETTVSLSTPAWTAVGGVANNSVTVPIGPGNQFYRLKK
jgi:hypothetical protein